MHVCISSPRHICFRVRQRYFRRERGDATPHPDRGCHCNNDQFDVRDTFHVPAVYAQLIMPHNMEPFPSPRVITSISAYVEHHPCFPILRCNSGYEGNAQLEIIMIVWDRNGATYASIVQRPNGGNQSSFTLLDRGDGLYGCTIEYTLGSNGNETFFANGTFLYFDSARDNVCVNSRSKRSPPDLSFPSPIHAHTTKTMATLLAHKNATRKHAISTSFYFLLLILRLR